MSAQERERIADFFRLGEYSRDKVPEFFRPSSSVFGDSLVNAVL